MALPPPNQQEGTTAHAMAEQGRADLRAALSSGDMTLDGLFAAVDAEDGPGGRIAGHMHIHSALLALPKIGEKRADAILTKMGWSHDRHVDTLGVRQREKLVEAVSEAQGY